MQLHGNCLKWVTKARVQASKRLIIDLLQVPGNMQFRCPRKQKSTCSLIVKECTELIQVRLQNNVCTTDSKQNFLIVQCTEFSSKIMLHFFGAPCTFELHEMKK